MTTLQTLLSAIAAGESTTLELKKSTGQRTEACRTLCAMANGRGGKLLFGVTAAGKVLGQAVSDKTLEELAQEFQSFEPPLFPDVERVSVEGELEILLVSVGRATRVPCSFRGVPYERVLNTTQVMPRVTYQRLLLEDMHAVQRWKMKLPRVGIFHGWIRAKWC